MFKGSSVISVAFVAINKESVTREGEGREELLPLLKVGKRQKTTKEISYCIHRIKI